MDVTSSAFMDGGRLPIAYVGRDGGGEDRSIPVAWSGAPAEAASFAVTVIDHAPIAREFVHWVVVNIPPNVGTLPDGASGHVPAGARELKNTRGTVGYTGPMPPAGSGDHPYKVTVYALKAARPDIPEHPSAADIDRAVRGSVLASGSVTGFYSRD